MCCRFKSEIMRPFIEQALGKMTDDEFFELSLRMQAAKSMRNIVNSNKEVTHEILATRMRLTEEEYHLARNAAIDLKSSNISFMNAYGVEIEASKIAG